MTKLLNNYKTASDVARMIEMREKKKIKIGNRIHYLWISFVLNLWLFKQSIKFKFPKIVRNTNFQEFVTAIFIWLVLILICIMLFSSCAHAWPDKFDSVDYAGQVLVTGFLIGDWGQTTYASYHYKYYSETNPILGRKPNRDQIHTYFAICTIGHAAISYLLPKKIEILGINIPARNIWQAVWIGIEANQVYRNYQIGVGWRF